MKKNILIGISIVVLLIAGTIYYLKTVPSGKTPGHTREFVDGRYEIRSFAGDNLLCGYDEVVEVKTNKKLWGSSMCEANIVDVREEGNNVIIVKSSMMGKEEIVVKK